jgi:putative oxidoreductase
MDTEFMSTSRGLRLVSDGRGAAANVLVRALVGPVFLSEGVQKFLFPEALGVGRFAKIGISMPQISAPFVGVVEIVAGALLLVGLLTRVAAILLLVDIAIAIATTKLPMVITRGFWATAHEARTDWSMLLGLVFLVVAGAGPRSRDARFASRRT